ncbi:MAG: hypothetical protein ABR975_10520 [Vulcanimicrobiaceae bacterium]|jgi:hypothetical protein
MGTLPAAALDAFSLRIGGLTIPVDAFVAMTLRGQPAEPYGYALDFEQTAASGVYATLVGSQGDGGTLTPPCPESNSPAPPAPMEANVTYLVVLEAASPVYCPDN